MRVQEKNCFGHKHGNIIFEPFIPNFKPTKLLSWICFLFLPKRQVRYLVKLAQSLLKSLQHTATSPSIDNKQDIFFQIVLTIAPLVSKNLTGLSKTENSNSNLPIYFVVGTNLFIRSWSQKNIFFAIVKTTYYLLTFFIYPK